MSNIFNTVQLQKPKRSTFDLTHDVKFSTRMGYLAPTLCMEVLPGDSIGIGADSLIRFAPLIAPVMHRFDATIHYFFVPNRLIYKNFEEFIVGEGEHVLPQITIPADINDYQKRFLDYMGIPLPYGAHAYDQFTVSALPFAAYQAIYNEYYRDQNLIPEFDYQLDDGVITKVAQPDLFEGLLDLKMRCWEHDFFTSALPWAQKGAAIDMPLGDVTLKDDWSAPPRFVNSDGDPIVSGGAFGPDPSSGITQISAPDNPPYAYDPNGSLEVGATTINNLRTAFKVQEWLERNARAGTRYTESNKAHFGVWSSDQRLQRPEYITGVKTPIVISEVLNTTGEDGGLPQGNMAGHAVSVGSGKSGYYKSEEHGFIIGIMSIMPKTAYMQGLPRMFGQRTSPYDWYWPSFAHLGEQEVKNKEIYIGDEENDREDTFGYQVRYMEYRKMTSRVAGQFRETLDFWHLARKFSSLPTLSPEFVLCDPDQLTRIFAVEDGSDELFCHVLHRIKAKRPLPYFGTPMM